MALVLFCSTKQEDHKSDTLTLKQRALKKIAKESRIVRQQKKTVRVHWPSVSKFHGTVLLKRKKE